MPKKYRVVQVLRIVSQTACFALFVYLLLETRRSGEDTIGAVERFFHFDPLLGLTTSVASRTLAAAFLFSLITVIATVVFGRYVCGWVCPLGSLHHFFSFLLGKGKRTEPRVEQSGRLAWKYWILIFVLVCSLFALDLVGFLDSLSFLYRSFTTTVLPATSLAAGAAIGLLDRAGFRSLGNDWSQLAQNLAVNTSFRQGLVVGLIFISVILLNVARERFWCRYLCPAGALLGLLARWNLVKLRIDADQCIECNRCNEVCQSQATPFPNEKWRPVECFYCYNCAAECPTEAISLPIALARRGRPPSISRAAGSC